MDYLQAKAGKVLPIEVKASTQGAMQSLWLFMRKRNLQKGVRTSLENFGHLMYSNPEADFEERHVEIVPLYVLSSLSFGGAL